MMQDFMLEESCEQMVRGTTRMEVVAGTVHTSTIDHCYTDSKEKVTGPFVEAVGDSDHLGVRILKLSKNEVSKPQIIKRRVYKNFSVGSFLTDIQHSNINNHVTSHDTIDGAAEAILDYHAPVKTIQLRRNYCPYLSSDTKRMIANRNALQKEAAKTGDHILLEEFKAVSKEVKKAVTKYKNVGTMRDLGNLADSKSVWRTAKNLLGICKNLSKR